MFHFNQTKSLALVFMMSTILTVAMDPDLPIHQARELGPGYIQVRELLCSNRQVQGSCIKTSSALDSASSALAAQAAPAMDMEDCSDFSCVVDFLDYSGYKNFKSACVVAKGTWATYEVSWLCGDSKLIGWENYPLCLISKKDNSVCTPERLEDDIGCS
jgi:hypothetical protein